MNKFQSVGKVISYNILILFALTGALIFVAPTAYFFAKPKGSGNTELLKLPNYQGLEWAKKNIQEFEKLKVKYFDFFVWRREDFSGETINIKDGLRQTYIPPVLTTDVKFWFFGGSTMFGSGVNDDGTFPSIFAKRAGAKAVNFGETGWMARQQLSMLVNQYMKDKIDTQKYIIFYDGINNVGTNCRADNDGFSTARQTQIQNQLEGMDARFGLKKTFQQFSDFIGVVKRKLNAGKKYQLQFYKCHNDLKRAKQAAIALVQTWVLAEKLATANGDKFLAILQPTAHLGKANTSHIQMNNPVYTARGKQLKIVYPIIRQEAFKRGVTFVDFTDVYDGNEFIYSDSAHVTPNGHEILAKELIKRIDLKN